MGLPRLTRAYVCAYVALCVCVCVRAYLPSLPARALVQARLRAHARASVGGKRGAGAYSPLWAEQSGDGGNGQKRRPPLLTKLQAVVLRLRTFIRCVCVGGEVHALCTCMHMSMRTHA